MGRGKRTTPRLGGLSAPTAARGSSGRAELDALLAEFALQSDVALLRRSSEALGMCQQVSQKLVDFLRGRGFDKPGQEAYLSGDEWEGGRMVIERVAPEDFGYYDRPQPGHNSHVVVMVDLAGERLMVDFTAAQYGYSDFPLVQRLLDERFAWERLPAERGPLATLA